MLHLQIQAFDLSVSKDLWIMAAAGNCAVLIAAIRSRPRR